MEEKELFDRLQNLLAANKTDEGIKLLIENTGKDKIINPTDKGKTESIWSFFGANLLRSGKLEDGLRVYRQMNETLLSLQKQDDIRYHKGSPLYNIGSALLSQAFNFFLLSFVEDVIDQQKFPEDLPSLDALQGIFKVDFEFLNNFSERILAEYPKGRDPGEVLTKLGVSYVPAELWQLEYKMLDIEMKLRRFIKKRLEAKDADWWNKLVPDAQRKKIEGVIEDSSKLLWFSEQTTSPLDYALFPQDYVELITSENAWSEFQKCFKHKAILKAKLSGLGQIRNKIAHYRTVSQREREMFTETVKWLSDCMK